MKEQHVDETTHDPEAVILFAALSAAANRGDFETALKAQKRLTRRGWVVERVSMRRQPARKTPIVA